MLKLPIDYSEVDALYRSTVGQGLGVIAITSATEKEGTTLAAITLAERSAAAKNKTLLIDLNLMSPQVAFEYHINQVDWMPQNLKISTIQESGISDLWVLSAPKKSASRWEFRDYEILSEWLKKLRKDFPVIIIDTSPLCMRNRGNIPSDTVCACADATLLCVLSGKTSYMRIKEAADKLKQANAKLYAAILNDCFTPSLSNELIRETYRLEHFLPNLMEKCRKFIKNSTLLNQDV